MRFTHSSGLCSWLPANAALQAVGIEYVHERELGNPKDNREFLQAVDIEYVHERELGNPKDNRELFRRGSQDARNVYTAHMRNGASQAVQKAVERTRSQYVALFYYERQHSQCHRSCIADEIGLHHSGLRVVEL